MIRSPLSKNIYLLLLSWQNLQIITKTHLYKYIDNFTTKKGNFSDKNKIEMFHVSAQK